MSTKRTRPTTKIQPTVVEAIAKQNEDGQWDSQVKKARKAVQDSRMSIDKTEKNVNDTTEKIIIDDILKILSNSHLRGPAKESAIMQLAKRIKVVMYVMKILTHLV